MNTTLELIADSYLVFASQTSVYNVFPSLATAWRLFGFTFPPLFVFTQGSGEQTIALKIMEHIIRWNAIKFSFMYRWDRYPSKINHLIRLIMHCDLALLKLH